MFVRRLAGFVRFRLKYCLSASSEGFIVGHAPLLWAIIYITYLLIRKYLPRRNLWLLGLALTYRKNGAVLDATSDDKARF